MDSALIRNRARKRGVKIIAADRERASSEINETVSFYGANRIVRNSRTAEIDIAVSKNFHPCTAAARVCEENARSRVGASASIGD